MKKIVLISLLVIILSGCGGSTPIDYSEYERVKDLCSRNDGISLFYYRVITIDYNSEHLIVGVKCNDGAVFRETFKESANRIKYMRE